MGLNFLPHNENLTISAHQNIEFIDKNIVKHGKHGKHPNKPSVI